MKEAMIMVMFAKINCNNYQSHHISNCCLNHCLNLSMPKIYRNVNNIIFASSTIIICKIVNKTVLHIQLPMF